MQGCPRPQQRCTCGHLGREHAGTIHAGACELRGCTCIRFTWTDHVPSDPDVGLVIATIGEMDDLALRATHDAVQARSRELRERQVQRDITEAWCRVEKLRPGAVLYAHARTMLGSFHRGDSVKVVRMDAARERLEVTLHVVGGKRSKQPKTWLLRPRDVHAYDFRRDKPEGGVPTKADRESAERIAKRLNEAFE